MTDREKQPVVSVLDGLKNRFTGAFKLADAVMRGRAVETIEYELGELDNIFGVLVLGALIGIPSPPIHITMALLPLMNRELDLMLEKVSTAHDPLSDLFSILQID